MSAPVVVFAFNRPDSLRLCISSLLRNSECRDTDLTVFIDGPRPGREDDISKIQEVRKIASDITGFHSVETRFSEANKGLGPSVIAGVSEVISRYGRAIVVEDDLEVSRNFLSFMNQGLNKYEAVDEVFSVCGYSNKVTAPGNYPYDVYFCPRSSSWGWATWKDRWESCDWSLDDWDSVRSNARAFNKWGGSDCFSMLDSWKTGKNKSWAIRFCYNQFIQGKLSLFPVVSRIDNNGFDGNGTNCKKWSRFKYDFDTSDFKDIKFPPSVKVDNSLRKQSLSYHSVPIRLYSRLMYLIHR